MELTTLNAFLDWLQNAGLPGGAPAAVTTQTVRQVIGPVPGSDVTPPTTAITCNVAACTTANYAAGVSVALNATDPGSGVERTVYTTDGSDPVTSSTVRRYTGPFPLSATSTVRYLSVDQAMNVETGRSQRITVGAADTTAPVTTDPMRRRGVLDGMVSGARDRHPVRDRRGIRTGVHPLHDRRERAIAREPALHGGVRGEPDDDRSLRIVGRRREQGSEQDRDDQDRCRRSERRDHVPAERRHDQAHRVLTRHRDGG